MDERRRWKYVNNQEGRKNYRRLRKELKDTQTRLRRNVLTAWYKSMEFQRTGCYHLIYMKAKDVGWKENHGVQTNDIEDSQGSIQID